MTINIEVWQLALIIIGAVVVIKFFNELIVSFANLLDRTIMQSLYNEYHKKGGIGESICNKIKGKTTTENEIGFVDRASK